MGEGRAIVRYRLTVGCWANAVAGFKGGGGRFSLSLEEKGRPARRSLGVGGGEVEPLLRALQPGAGSGPPGGELGWCEQIADGLNPARICA